MKEIINLRKENEKHFLCEDGTMKAYYYKESIHYLDHGKYKDIDNTLILDGNFYKNKANDFKVIFANCKDNSLLYKIEKDNKYVEFSLSTLKSNNCEITVENNTIKYKNIYDKIDYIYKVIGQRVKETIILNSLNKLDIKFLIRTNLNLVLEANTINAYQGKNIIYSFEQPFMYDSEDKRYLNIQYILDKRDGYYVLTLDLNKDWLKKAKLPVYIDPNITTVKSQVHDTYIYPGDTGQDKNSESWLKIGVDSQSNIYRTLIKFDLPILSIGTEIIRAAANFVSHKYDTIYTEVETPEFEPIVAHEIISEWDESSANWDNMSDKFNPSIESENIFYRTLVERGSTAPAQLRQNSVDITNLVKRWYKGKKNNGVMLKFANEEYNSSCSCYKEISNNHNFTDFGDEVRPYLLIQYINTGGISNYRQYDNYSFKNGISYLDVYNGNLTVLINLNNTLGGKFPIELNAIINNSFIESTNDKNAWKFNLLETITKETERINQIEREYIHYIDSTNKTTNFYKVKDEETKEEFYQNEEGLNLTLTEEENKFIITDKDGNIKTFTKNGEKYYLTKIINTEKNEVNIFFNDKNQIIKVVDGSNQEINITYNTDKIIISTTEKSSAIYLENNKIIKVLTKHGTTNLKYMTLIKTSISQITDENGIGLQFSYTEEGTSTQDLMKKMLEGLIYKVTELGVEGITGQTIKYKYGFNTTKVTNDKNQTYTYLFNNTGMCIGTTLMDPSGKLSKSYGFNQKFINIKSDKKNNKPTSETPPIKFVNNLLSNSSFEKSETNPIFNAGIRSTEYAKTGKYSYKGDFIECYFRDYSINLERGKDYTFSAYVKCNSSFKVNICTRNINKIILLQTINYSKNENFEQIIAPFKYPTDTECYIDIEIIPDEKSTIYLDDVQLEEGLCASKYNLVENSCFKNGIANWDISSQNLETGESYPNCYSIVNVNDHEKALQLKSRVDSEISASQYFQIEGKKGDVYHLSFWYKDQGLYNEECVSEMEGNKANIQFFFKDPDKGIGTHNIVFNKHSDEWQFFSESFIADEDYNGFNLNILSLVEANSLFITDVMLVKELGEYTFEYDEEGNLISSSNLDGGKNTLKYDINNQLIGAFNPKGNNYKYEYDNTVKTRILKGISPTGISNEIEYDSFGNPIKTIINNVNSDGIIKEDKFYQLRLKGTKKYIDINFDLNKIILKPDNCNHKAFKLEKVMNDEEEYYRLNYFDNFLTFANETLYISKALDDTILFKLEALNNASYVIIPKREQARIENGINIAERCITIKEDGTVSVEVRDRENSYQQFYLEDTDTNKFIESISEYTEDGKFITKVIDSLGKETFYDVDPSTGLTMSITNPKEIVTKYTYNTKDQVKTITSNEKTVTYDYNTQNMLSKIASGKKHYNFEYDEFLNTKKIDINGQTLVTNNFEEKNGNLLSCEYGNGNKINYSYDEFNRLKTYTASGKIYTNEYNSIGELSNVYGGSENHYYFYDFANRLSKYLLTDFTTTFEIDYNYDKNGNVTNTDYNLFSAGNHDLSSKINYEYNKDDSIVKVSFDNHSLNNTYDYLGRLEKKSIDNTLKIEYTYYGRGNKTSLIVKSVKIDDDLYEYKYDNLYNITDIYLNGELTNHYEYDMFNQLTMDMNYTLTKSYTFTYNTEGNILDKREYNLETNELLNIDTYEYSNTDWEDQLTKFNNEEITYDEIGNPLTIGDKTLTWQSGRQLKQVLNSDNTLNIMYEYNKDGIRTSKIVGQVNKTEY